MVGLWWYFAPLIQHTGLDQREPYANGCTGCFSFLDTEIESLRRFILPTVCPPSRPSALAFPLPGILPRQTRLLLDREAHLAILLSFNSTELIPALSLFPLTPSATRVLFSLLQAYPEHCSHRTLFSALFPLTQQSAEEERIWEKSLALRPIRRACSCSACFWPPGRRLAGPGLYAGNSTTAGRQAGPR